MTPIRTILHPTDFSTRSDSALYFAASLARDYRARLIVLHVGQRPMQNVGGTQAVPATPEEFGREDLERHLRERKISGVDVELRLEFADQPADGILGVADEIDADVIVIGTHGRTGLARLLMGSVAEQVVRRAKCLVVSVRSPEK